MQYQAFAKKERGIEMAYADYEFYTTKYYGKLKKEEFEEYSDKASDWLDVPTFNRLSTGIPDNEISSTKIQKCVCAIAEAMYKFQRAEDMADIALGDEQNKAVKSFNSGSESVTYLSIAEIMNGVKEGSPSYAAAGDEDARNKYLADITRKYLMGVTDSQGTPLLYAGI